MGAWSFGALDNDSALDAILEVNHITKDFVLKLFAEETTKEASFFLGATIVDASLNGLEQSGVSKSIQGEDLAKFNNLTPMPELIDKAIDAINYCMSDKCLSCWFDKKKRLKALSDTKNRLMKSQTALP